LLNRSQDLSGIEAHPKSQGSIELVLLSDAAAVITASLVETFHGMDSLQWVEAGKGWSVADDPLDPRGLSGGSFDDVGFPAASRVLASDGLWVGGLGGPGTFRRASFREPPMESASNLIVAPGPAKPLHGLVARRCRLLRVSSNLWVLELDQPDGPRWVRTDPEQLLAGCQERIGRAEVTPAGPIVPALRFEGLQVEGT
jgi:hypothetical protein